MLALQAVREETFTFTPDGEPPVHIRSGRLREWLLENAMHKVQTLIFPEQTLEELILQHGLEEPRMESMTEEEANDPVVVGSYPDGTFILIDGGHRRWFWAKRGQHKLRGWAVPYELWSTFIFDENDPAIIRHVPDGSLLPQRMKK